MLFYFDGFCYNLVQFCQKVLVLSDMWSNSTKQMHIQQYKFQQDSQYIGIR